MIGNGNINLRFLSKGDHVKRRKQFNPWEDPDTQEWAQGVLDNLVPMIESTSMTISLVPKGKADVKFAVELGMSIMLGKPLLVVVFPGVHVPNKLVQIADEIVEIYSVDEPGAMDRMQEAMQRIMDKLNS